MTGIAHGSGRAAGALALAALAVACAGPRNQTGPTPARSYATVGYAAIGPSAPGLSPGDPGELTRWQEQMARDMRAGPQRGQRAQSRAAQPARSTPIRTALVDSRPVRSAGGAPAPFTTAGAPSTPITGDASGAGGEGAAALALGPAPLLARASLTETPRPLAAKVAAVSAQPWTWLGGILAGFAAALVLAWFLRPRRATRPSPVSIGPESLRPANDLDRRPLQKRGPPPPKVTILASGRG